ncbi:hypothetical protein CZP2022_196 [Vibrio phage C-ZP2022]|nr:hypothetical protein CZP2022_196 [Vibrio phage C-ZP2022]
MKQPVVLHLGAKNVVKDPEDLLRMLFIQAYTATAQQGKGLGNVFSFQYLTGLYGNEPKEFIRQMESQFGEYLRAYFPEGASVIVSDVDSHESARYTIELSARITHGGQSYQLSEVLRIDPDKTLTRITNATRG